METETMPVVPGNINTWEVQIKDHSLWNVSPLDYLCISRQYQSQDGEGEGEGEEEGEGEGEGGGSYLLYR